MRGRRVLRVDNRALILLAFWFSFPWTAFRRFDYLSPAACSAGIYLNDENKDLLLSLVDQIQNSNCTIHIIVTVFVIDFIQTLTNRVCQENLVQFLVAFDITLPEVFAADIIFTISFLLPWRGAPLGLCPFSFLDLSIPRSLHYVNSFLITLFLFTEFLLSEIFLLSSKTCFYSLLWTFAKCAVLLYFPDLLSLKFLNRKIIEIPLVGDSFPK